MKKSNLTPSLGKLQHHYIRGGVITIATQWIRFGIRMIATIILARLLAPSVFGLVAMVSAVLNFVKLFKDFGLSKAIIQKKSISEFQMNNLFWFNVIFSISITILLVLVAPVVAWFYGEPTLKWITIALSFTFLINGLSAQHEALLRRNMRFTQLSFIQVFKMIISMIAAIAAAYLGAGYWSLIVMNLTSAFVSTVCLWIMGGWFPGLPSRNTGLSSMMKFGLNVTGFNFANYFARNLDDILLGKFYGSTALGFYSKAYQILMLPLDRIRDPLNSVSLSIFSRLQEQNYSFKKYYLNLVQTIAFLSMPLSVFVAIHADCLITLFLGDKWMGAAVICRVLAIAAFIQPSASTRGVVLLSLGQSTRYLKSGIYYSLIVIVAFSVGIFWGGLGIAIAYTIANYLVLLPILSYCFRFTPVSINVYLKAIIRPFIASLVTCTIMLLAKIMFSHLHQIYQICVGFIAGLLTYLIVLLLLPGGSSLFKRYISILKLSMTSNIDKKLSSQSKLKVDGLNNKY